MVYFLFSFFIGGLLALIPISRDLLNLVASIFYEGPLETWRLFLVSGVAFSVMFFASKSIIQKQGHIAFWKIVITLALFIILFLVFSANSPLVIF